MSVRLYRIDDRLIHGQVVVGWGQPLDIEFIVLVDDNVASSDWEQDLYRMGIPPEMEILFADVASAARDHERYVFDSRPGIVVTGDIATMDRLVCATGTITSVNVGGLHYRAGRSQKSRYVFLTPGEERELRDLASRGVKVTAQDVPAARQVPIEEVLGDAPPDRPGA